MRTLIPIRTRLRRRLASCLAVASTAGMMLVGLPATVNAAPGDYAKVTSGGRCDKMHLGKTFPRTPNNSGAPTGQHHWTKGGPDEEYYFNLEFKGFEDVSAPTRADLNSVGNSMRCSNWGWPPKRRCWPPIPTSGRRRWCSSTDTLWATRWNRCPPVP